MALGIFFSIISLMFIIAGVISVSNGAPLVLLTIPIFGAVLFSLPLIQAIINYRKNKFRIRKKVKTIEEEKNELRKTRTLLEERISAFKNQSEFEQYYFEITSLSSIKKGQYYKPVVAAYLFVISDFIMLSNNDFQKRNEKASTIFNILESKILTDEELMIFDKCVDIFGQIVRSELEVRADWQFNDIIHAYSERNPLLDLYFCLGDLIIFPEYIFDYQNSKTVILPITSTLDITKDFNLILDMTSQYIKAVENS